jgi:hypothetical protein
MRESRRIMNEIRRSIGGTRHMVQDRMEHTAARASLTGRRGGGSCACVLSAPSGDFDTYRAFQVEQERQQTTCLAYADSTVTDSPPARRPQLPLVKRCKLLPSLGSERPAHTKGYNLIAGLAHCQ